MPDSKTNHEPMACEVPRDPLDQRGAELLVKYGTENSHLCGHSKPLRTKWVSRERLMVSPCATAPTMIQSKLKNKKYRAREIESAGPIPTKHPSLPDTWFFEGMDEMAIVMYVKCPVGSSEMVTRSPPFSKAVPNYQDRINRADEWSSTLADTPYNFISLTTDSVSVGLMERVSPKLAAVLNGQHPSFPQAAETGFRLGGLNVLGDGTINAFLPFLTGNIEQEMPDARRAHLPENDRTFPLQEFPWIFHPLKERGYVTSFQGTASDMWSYRLTGFKTAPWDMDIRLAWPIYKKRSANYECASNMSVLCMDYLKNLAQQAELESMPLFAVCHTIDTHDRNPLALWRVDDELIGFLRWFWSPEAADIAGNTILFIGADHGPRYGDLRKEREGKIMERRPYGYLFLPPRLLESRPEVAENLRANEHVLTTFRDLHLTVGSILNISDALEPGRCGTPECELSLVDQVIPRSRTCESAGIEPAWCSCITSTDIPIPESIVPVLIDSLACVNGYLNRNSDMQVCATQSIVSVGKLSAFTLPISMLAFQQSKDKDGRIPDLDMSSVELSKLLTGEYALSITSKPDESSSTEAAHYDIVLELPWLIDSLDLTEDQEILFKEVPGGMETAAECNPSVASRTDKYSLTLTCTPAATTVENFCLCKT